MDFDTEVKLAVYRHFAEAGRPPAPADVARVVDAGESAVADAYFRLRAARVLHLEDDGLSIRMAPPFSGVATQHVVEADGLEYYANCAWDALGVLAAIKKPGRVRSRCERSGEPLELAVGLDGPEATDWLFHSLVPAAHWWDDIVFT